ncbi:lipid-A-disaccharide synthase [Ginsengibacter hankyongi]|uniref:Lipid-A-disaccharide synthase n=1 Tax=Ginsengibacter hankyongi TaxID=2607284 RepID=A0A5J5IM15_9BACT|nr:lipid-A-disaccharide synthase [Ginsengibacter hankyongi]KAA9040894.1 lipid-A-disaccharide synthase [Ginsengibacter hankyongi]
MKYYIIAGEASGDLHGSNLIKEIKKLDADADMRGWGGDKMQAAGATLVKHYRDLAFMGFAEVIKNLPAIMKNFKFCKEDIQNYNPDVVVLIDYPGFNLRMAEWTHQKKFKTVFYISPQVWAWKENRVKAIKKYVDKMIVILPFEKQFFKKWNYDVEYVGHPLVEVIESFKKEHPSIKQSSNIIALLPGSRRQEIQTKLPIMLEASKNFPDYTFIVAKAPSVEDEFYEPFLSGYKNVEVISNDTYSLLMKANAALVTSGTATLETALFGVPEIICYKASSLSYQIAKRLVKLKFICLVNLIMDKEVVKELIQHELTGENITKELNAILFDTLKRERMEMDYADLKNLLSKGGNASANAAKSIYEFAKGEW